MFDIKIKIEKDNLLLAILYASLMLVENFVLLNADSRQYNIWCTMLSFFVVFNVAFMIVSFAKLKIPIVSVGGFFILLSYMFHFGQVIINAFVQNYGYSLLNAVGAYSIYNVEALMFCFNVIGIITMFIMLSNQHDCKRRVVLYKFKKIDSVTLKLMSLKILVITVPFQIIDFIQGRDLYARTNGEAASGIKELGMLSIVGFVMLIISYQDKKKKAKSIFFATVFWHMILMLNGSRIYSVVAILILFYFYINIIQKLNFKRLIVYGILGVFFLQILNTIMHLRTRGTVRIDNMLNYMLLSNQNILTSTLEEFGGSIYTVAIAFKEIPRYLQYNCGKSYIGGIALIGVDLVGVFPKIMDNLAFTRHFVTKYNYGGSYIGELYYNFGLCAYFLAPLIGVWIGKVSNRLSNCIKKHDYLNGITYVMLFFGFMIWVRGYFNAIPRCFVWGYLLIWFVYRTTAKNVISEDAA